MSGYQSYGIGSMNPEPLGDNEDMIVPFDKGAFRDNKVRVALIFSGDVVRNWYVIVETWSHLCGSKKRKYLAEFTEKERKVISRYHTSLYRWYLITGSPQQVEMKISTYKLMCRAADFFASI